MTYQSIPHRRRTEDGTEYIGYDILGQEAGREPLLIEDVTEDGRFAEALCAALNREGAEPVHVFDIISDFLSDEEWKNSLLYR